MRGGNAQPMFSHHLTQGGKDLAGNVAQYDQNGEGTEKGRPESPAPGTDKKPEHNKLQNHKEQIITQEPGRMRQRI